MLEWAAPMDWMCEPAMLARTGLTVEDHQRRTVANFLELRERGPELHTSQLPGSNSVAYNHVRSASSIAGRVSVAIGVERPAEGKHSHDVFHSSTRRGYEFEIHPGHIKQLWTGQAVVITPGSGEPTIAQICHPQEARP